MNVKKSVNKVIIIIIAYFRQRNTRKTIHTYLITKKNNKVHIGSNLLRLPSCPQSSGS